LRWLGLGVREEGSQVFRKRTTQWGRSSGKKGGTSEREEREEKGPKGEKKKRFNYPECFRGKRKGGKQTEVKNLLEKRKSRRRSFSLEDKLETLKQFGIPTRNFVSKKEKEVRKKNGELAAE